ncbi:MAG: MraY family glycosyltransferase [Anaerolineales bacterium]
MRSYVSYTVFIFEAILLSLVVVFVLAWISIRFSWWIGLIDYPGSASHKTHTIPTPQGGGIALILTLIITGLIFNTLQNRDLVITLLASSLVFIFGLWDDYHDISPLLKLLGQVLAAILLVRGGVGVKILESPEFFFNLPKAWGFYLDWLISILWVVGITNAFNFVDSKDGLAVGLGGVASAFFMLVTLDSQQYLLSRHSALLLGMCAGLYFFNSSPAHIFLGDSGAQTLGFVLASLAILYNPMGAFQTSSWLVPVLILGVPIFDMILVVFSRLRRGRPVHQAALDHTYHRLVYFGFDPNRVVLGMHIVALLLGCLAFVSLAQSSWFANIVFASVLVMGAGLILWMDSHKRMPGLGR